MNSASPRVEKATELFMAGYNCAQAVSGAFCDVLGLPLETVLAISAAFGGGFARTRHLCGAVSGMGLVLGFCSSNSACDNKPEIYQAVRLASDEFSTRFGSLDCCELLKNIDGINDDAMPDERTALYYKQRPCLSLVCAATELAQKCLKDAGKIK
ncbi:MAG: C-GCAxxG-C-C family protein [Oscillospiraceae bacterium]